MMLYQGKTLWRSTRLVLVLVLAVGASACWTTHSEEALTWCGPATAQMIIENDTKAGCPNSVLQEDLWATIESTRVDAAWDTDPIGMEKALEQTAPCAWSWHPIHYSDESVFMRNVAYYMYRYGYPAAVVLDTIPHASYPAHAEHWVSVMGVLTTPDPTTVPASTPVTLDIVLYIDPSPPVFGDAAIIELISGATWFARLQPVNKPASTVYHSDYVAVIEPPEIKGVVVAKKEPLVGDIMNRQRVHEMAMAQLEKLMHSERAMELMERHDVSRVMKQYGLPASRPLENLERARPLEPLLVNQKRGAYYVVPLTFEGSRWQGQAQAAIAINAYDGRFQELGIFKPTRYLNKELVYEISRKIPQLAREKIIDVEPVYIKSTHAHRLMPQWSVKTDKRVHYLDNRGQLEPVKRVDQPTDRINRPPIKKERIKR